MQRKNNVLCESNLCFSAKRNIAGVLNSFKHCWVAIAGFLGTSSSFVSPHVGSFCRFLGSLYAFVSLCLGSFCRAPGLRVFVCLLHVGYFCRVPKLLLSPCLPSCGSLFAGCLSCLSPLVSLSPFMWVPLPGSSLSPLVSFGIPSCGFLLRGS